MVRVIQFDKEIDPERLGGLAVGRVHSIEWQRVLAGSRVGIGHSTRRIGSARRRRLEIVSRVVLHLRVGFVDHEARNFGAEHPAARIGRCSACDLRFRIHPIKWRNKIIVVDEIDDIHSQLREEAHGLELIAARRY